MGSIGNTPNVERTIRTDITKRQLKTHVTSVLKQAGLTKAETSSSSVRGYRTVNRAGFGWGEEFGGTTPNITYVASTHATNTSEYLDKVENVLSPYFKLDRWPDRIEILGEYEDINKRR